MSSLKDEVQAAIQACDTERFIYIYDYYKNLIVAHLQEHQLNEAAILANQFDSEFSNLKIDNAYFAESVCHLFPINSNSVYQSLFLGQDLADHLIEHKINFDTCLLRGNAAYLLTKYAWIHKDSSILEKLIVLWNKQKSATENINNFASIQTRISYCLRNVDYVKVANFKVSDEIDGLSAFSRDIESEAKINSSQLLPLVNVNFKHYVYFMLRHGKVKFNKNTKHSDIAKVINQCIPKITTTDDAVICLLGTKGLLGLNYQQMHELFVDPKFDFDGLVNEIRNGGTTLFGAFDSNNAINDFSQQLSFEFFSRGEYKEKLSALIDALLENEINRVLRREGERKQNPNRQSPEFVMDKIIRNSTNKSKAELLINLSHYRKRANLERDLSV